MVESTFIHSSQLSKQRLLWVAFIILLFLIAGVWWYQKREAVALPLTKELGAIDERFKELITLVETIQRITLDAAILQDTRFSSLERTPFSAEVTPEEAGRVNPFAPFEESSKAVIKSTQL